PAVEAVIESAPASEPLGEQQRHDHERAQRDRQDEADEVDGVHNRSIPVSTTPTSPKAASVSRMKAKSRMACQFLQLSRASSPDGDQVPGQWREVRFTTDLDGIHTPHRVITTQSLRRSPARKVPG